MKRVVVLVFLAMVVIGSCVAQSANNDAQRIVGTWVSEDGSNTLVFNANGTGTWNGDTISYGISTSGDMRIIGPINGEAKLYMSPDGRRMIYSGKVYQKK
jgi:hypothetical protein